MPIRGGRLSGSSRVKNSSRPSAEDAGVLKSRSVDASQQLASVGQPLKPRSLSACDRDVRQLRHRAAREESIDEEKIRSVGADLRIEVDPPVVLSGDSGNDRDIGHLSVGEPPTEDGRSGLRIGSRRDEIQEALPVHTGNGVQCRRVRPGQAAHIVETHVADLRLAR